MSVVYYERAVNSRCYRVTQRVGRELSAIGQGGRGGGTTDKLGGTEI